jgi:hypothetical protein
MLMWCGNCGVMLTESQWLGQEFDERWRLETSGIENKVHRNTSNFILARDGVPDDEV